MFWGTSSLKTCAVAPGVHQQIENKNARFSPWLLELKWSKSVTGLPSQCASAVCTQITPACCCCAVCYRVSQITNVLPRRLVSKADTCQTLRDTDYVHLSPSYTSSLLHIVQEKLRNTSLLAIQCRVCSGHSVTEDGLCFSRIDRDAVTACGQWVEEYKDARSSVRRTIRRQWLVLSLHCC